MMKGPGRSSGSSLTDAEGDEGTKGGRECGDESDESSRTSPQLLLLLLSGEREGDLGRSFL